MKISTTNPLLAILEASRRDFLRRAGGTAVAAATKGPAGVLKSVIGGALKDAGGVGGIIDKLAHISDEELSETPEEEWINIVPSERLANMVKSGKYDPSHEAAHKIYRMLYYGIDYEQTLPILKMMAKAASKSGLNPKQMMDAAVTKNDWLYDVFGGFTEYPGSGGRSSFFKESGEITKEISQIYNNLDIELVGDVRNQVIKKDLTAERQAWDEHKRYEEREEERKREQKREQNQKNKPEEFNPPNDYYMASPMHQPFESKLKAQLDIIFG